MRSANQVEDEGGRQYHIGLAPGEVAPWVLLVGDPARVKRAETLLDEVELRRHHREYVSATGRYHGLPVTVLGTGIGCDNTEIAIVELLRCQPRPTLLRVGSSGALQPEPKLGDLVVSTGAVRLESTSLAYVDEGFPAVAHHEAVLALVSAAERSAAPCHVGLTATASGFYGWQGRTDSGFTPKDPELVPRLRKMGVMNFEMEASTLLTLASLAGLRAGVVCAVFANRVRDEFIEGAAKEEAELRALGVGLAACEILSRVDAASGDRPFHLTQEMTG